MDFTKVLKPLGNTIKNVYIKLKIDLDEGHLFYAIDDNDYQKVPYALRKDRSYRLSVTLPTDKEMSEIQLE